MQKIYLCVSCVLLSWNASTQESDVAHFSRRASELLHNILENSKRASLANAQESKRATIEVVDLIYTEEKGIQPGLDVSDAPFGIAREIPGERGDGCGTALRAITRMESTPHSRDVFCSRSRYV